MAASGGAAPVTAVLLAGGEPGPGLVEAVGEPRASRVRELLVARAHAWASAAFGPAAVRRLDHEPSADGWREAFATAGEGTVIICAPELPSWRADLAAAALEDLAAGCVACVGPVFAGGAYLVGLRASEPGVRSALADLDLSGRGVLTAFVTRASEAGWEMGLLRTERALRDAADVRALLVDPLTDGELRKLLG